jgi:hypothetical protein
VADGVEVQAMMAQEDAAKEAREEPVGIVCRTCGCRHFFVIDSRPARGGKIVRRRECRHCGTRITTREIPYGSK